MTELITKPEIASCHDDRHLLICAEPGCTQNSESQVLLENLGDKNSRPVWSKRVRWAPSAAGLFKHKGDPPAWLGELIDRRNADVTAVALADKNARIVWALLAHEREFEPGYTSTRA